MIRLRWWKSGPYFTAFSLRIPDMRSFLNVREIVKICPRSPMASIKPVFRYRTPKSDRLLGAVNSEALHWVHQTLYGIEESFKPGARHKITGRSYLHRQSRIIMVISIGQSIQEMTITITPADATLGAVVTDVDLAGLTDATWAAIHAAFLEYGVLAFPGQHLDEESQGAFARRFGNTEQLSPTQTGPTIEFTNRKADSSLAKSDEQQFHILKGNEGWHTDSTYMPLASKAAMLAALVVPAKGGETEFADMRAAWDVLDEETQARLERLSAYHSLYHSQAKAGFNHKTDNLYGFHDKGAPLRPIIKTHPETGRKSIHTGRHAYGIPSLSEAESEDLLKKLLEDACQPPRIYQHAWQPGDIVVWDNRCLMHRARPYDPDCPRTLRASRISGEPETELASTFADARAEAFRPTTSNVSSLLA